jgi:hypothetical protein
LPENGLAIAAEIVKKTMIKPLYSPPPISVKYEFNSGRITLKLNIKNSIDNESNQKEIENDFSMLFKLKNPLQSWRGSSIH